MTQKMTHLRKNRQHYDSMEAETDQPTTATISQKHTQCPRRQQTISLHLTTFERATSTTRGVPQCNGLHLHPPISCNFRNHAQLPGVTLHSQSTSEKLPPSTDEAPQYDAMKADFSIAVLQTETSPKPAAQKPTISPVFTHTDASFLALTRLPLRWEFMGDGGRQTR